MIDQLTIKDLGLIDFQDTWDYQLKWLEKGLENIKNNQAIQQELLLLEHHPVYTLGKSADEQNLLINDVFLKNIGAKSYKIDRGGDITYHGPGQLVVYPLLDLQVYKMGVKDYVFALEQTIINVLKNYGIESDRVEGKTGIWLDIGNPNERKIAAIGIKCSRYLTMHGLAFNINTDLSYFNHIVPCGIADKGVTSLSKELNQKIDMELLKNNFTKEFNQQFITQ